MCSKLVETDDLEDSSALALIALAKKVRFVSCSGYCCPNDFFSFR